MNPAFSSLLLLSRPRQAESVTSRTFMSRCRHATMTVGTLSFFVYAGYPAYILYPGPGRISIVRFPKKRPVFCADLYAVIRHRKSLRVLASHNSFLNSLVLKSFGGAWIIILVLPVGPVGPAPCQSTIMIAAPSSSYSSPTEARSAQPATSAAMSWV